MYINIKKSIYNIIYNGVVERWGNLRFFFLKRLVIR